ncbi:MAG: hypothetical protein ABIH92_00315, partial [Nanoarchaeota archaeon]
MEKRALMIVSLFLALFVLLLVFNEGDLFFSPKKLLKKTELQITPDPKADDVFQSIPKEVSLTGTLETIIFDGENLRYEYFINSDGERTQVHFVEPVYLISGTPVEVKGRVVDGKIVVLPRDLEVVSLQLSPNASVQSAGDLTQIEPDPIETLGEQKTAVILVRFNDSSPEPFLTPEQAEQIIFNGTVQEFYRESSYENLWFTGDVFGWYTLPEECCAGAIDEEVAINLSDSDIYFPDYDRIVIIVDNRDPCPDLIWGWGTLGKWDLESNDGPFRASIAHVGHARRFFNTSPMPSGGERTYEWLSGEGLIVHELGHNLGAAHAKSYDCGGEILHGDCEIGNYGNLFDVMGKAWIFGPMFQGDDFENNTNAAFHFNARFKKYFKWLRSNSVLKITGNGTYILKPLERTPTIIAKVKQEGYPQLPPFYLEYRV